MKASKLTRIIKILVMFLIMLLIIAFFDVVEAATSIGYVTITKIRKEQGTLGPMTYMHQLYKGQTSRTKNIWNLVTCTAEGLETDEVKDLYCLRAGLGFTTEDLSSSGNKVVNYNVSYEMPSEYNKLVNDFASLHSEISIFDSTGKSNFDAVMWILDHMLLSSASDTEYKDYLKAHAGYKPKDLTKSEDLYNVLTRSDIEAITQLAIWYYTNSDENDYHQATLPTIYMKLTGDEFVEKDDYDTFAGLFDGMSETLNDTYGQERQEAAGKLYKYLIDTAKAETQDGNYTLQRKITIHTVGTNMALEQPIVSVEEKESTIEVQVTKKWDDNENQDGKRKAYKVKIVGTANNIEVYSEEVEMQADELTHTFRNLPEYKDGVKVEYTVTETVVPDEYHYSVTGNAKDGFTITNTYTPKTVDVKVDKIWEDKDNQDGKRDKYTVKIEGRAHGEVVYTNEVELQKGETTHTWTGLPKYDEGEEIEYTVTESVVPAEYDASVTSDAKNEFKITNRYTPKTVDVKVEKIWEDKDNQDGKRKRYKVKIVGKANGEQVYSSEVELEPDKLTHTWTGLAKYHNGIEIEYTVTESLVPDGYEEEVTGDAKSGFKIKNKYTPEKTSVSVDKIWSDNDNQDGKRNKYKVKIEGTAHGKVVHSEEVELQAGTTHYEWTDLDKYNNGEEIVYTVTESLVPDGYEEEVTGDAKNGFTITNTHTPAKTSVSVEKIWSDNDDQDGKRTSYKVKVVGMVDGQIAYQEEKEMQKGENSYTWNNLPKYKDGKEIQYTVIESEIPDDYTPSISGDAENGFTITNTHTPEETKVQVTKTWVDNQDQDGKRNSYEVKLEGKVDGVTVIEKKQMLDKNTLSHTWDKLPKYHEGKLIVYTVTESIIPNEYEANVTGNPETGFNVTNTHTPAKVSVNVEKEWDDKNNQDGKRGTYNVKITGTAKGRTVYENEVPLPKETLKYIWENLEKYYQGELITYTVTESFVPADYKYKVEGDQNSGFRITNTHTPEETSVKVTKVWNDNNDQDGKRSEYKVKITGTAKGKKVYEDEQTLPKDTLTYTWEHLAKFYEGEQITYTVVESLVPDGYQEKVEGTQTSNFTITNTRVPEETSVSVKKIWNDENDQDGRRGTYKVKITGTAHGEKVYENEVELGKNNTSYTWEKLPKYNKGELVKYTVEESFVPADYQASVTGNQDEGFEITNTHTPEETQVTVNKVWNDSNNQDGKRTSYKVKILGTAKGVTVYENEVLLEKDNLTYTWNHLDKYYDGELINYTVTESLVPEGYTADIEGNQTEGFTITNSYTPDKVNVRVDKIWQDNNDRAGLRDKYKVKLIGTAGEDIVYENEVTLEKDNLSYIWQNLAKYNQGRLITYTVEESEVPSGYIAKVEGNQQEGYRITNTNNAQVDVALRKFITAVNGEKLEGDKSRVPDVDTNKLDKYEGETYQTTAEYNHTKKPVEVKVGDIVTYTLRLYNEGEVDTYIKEVTDYLPPYLQYVPYGDDNGTWWNIDEGTKRKTETTRKLHS